MGTYLIRDDVEKIMAVLHERLESEGFELIDKHVGPAKEGLATKWATPGLNGIESRVVVKECGDASLVRAEFSCSLLHRILLLVSSISCATIIILGLLNFDEFLLSALSAEFDFFMGLAFFITAPTELSEPLPELPKSNLLLSAGIIACFCIWRVDDKLETEATHELAQVEKKFWSFFKAEFRFRQVAMSNPQALTTGYAIVYVLTLYAFLSILLFKLHPLLLLFISPFWLFAFPHSLTPYLYEREPGLYPRILSAIASNKVLFLNGTLLLLVGAGVCFTAVDPLAWETRMDRTSTPLATLRQCFAEPSIGLDGIHSGSARMDQLNNQAETVISRLSEEAPQVQEHRPYIRGVLITLVALLVACTLWMLYLLFTLLGKSLFEIAISWRNYAAEEEIDSIRLPPSLETAGLDNILFRLSIILMFICGAVLNIAALIVAIDTTCFVFKDQTLFLPPIQASLSWFFVPFLAFGMSVGSQHAWLWDSLARLVIMVIASPPLIILGRRTIGTAWNLKGELSDVVMCILGSRCVPQELKTHVGLVCVQYGITKPRIRRVGSETIHLSVKTRFFGRKPILLVSDGALSQLSVLELNAAVAHELAHIKQGMHKHMTLRILSSLGGFPPWFLLLLVDFRRLEEQADIFALRLGAEPQSLAHAIIKTSCFGNLVGDQTHSIVRRIANYLAELLPASFLQNLKSVLILDRFLNSDDLVGYSHPLPRDRIATILMNMPPPRS
jgi:Zn-dependent protease with chaperone function